MHYRRKYWRIACARGRARGKTGPFYLVQLNRRVYVSRKSNSHVMGRKWLSLLLPCTITFFLKKKNDLPSITVSRRWVEKGGEKNE